MLKTGKISIGGNNVFVAPGNYTTTVKGSPSQIIPTSSGYYVEPGYSFHGFTISASVLDAGVIANIETLAKEAWSTGTPIDVTDDVHPSGSKSWTGFIELPVVTSGSALIELPGYPSRIMTETVQITFFSSEAERT